MSPFLFKHAQTYMCAQTCTNDTVDWRYLLKEIRPIIWPIVASNGRDASRLSCRNQQGCMNSAGVGPKKGEQKEQEEQEEQDRRKKNNE